MRFPEERPARAGCWADGRGVTTAYEAGVSNGAFMAHRLALEESDRRGSLPVRRAAARECGNAQNLITNGGVASGMAGLC
jgi:hypothetical protein